MLKIKSIFKNKIKSNTKYKIGDVVYMLAYPYKRFCFGSGRIEIQGLHEEIKIFKMTITKIEISENDDKTRYFTNVKTGLEHEFGGYYEFDNWETIQEAINRFVDDEYKIEKADD